MKDIVERLNEANAEIERLSGELEAERKCRDGLVAVMSDLIALFGTERCRPYSVFRDAVSAMAVAVTLGYSGPITLAHADDVHRAADAWLLGYAAALRDSKRPARKGRKG